MPLDIRTIRPWGVKAVSAGDTGGQPTSNREAGAEMTAHSGLRLLPWVGPEGKPCYLNTDDSEGFMSRLADHIESIQLGMASELLEQAAPVLDDGTANEEELSLLAAQLAGALRDVLRVAMSRGRGHTIEPATNADFDL